MRFFFILIIGTSFLNSQKCENNKKNIYTKLSSFDSIIFLKRDSITCNYRVIRKTYILDTLYRSTLFADSGRYFSNGENAYNDNNYTFYVRNKDQGLLIGKGAIKIGTIIENLNPYLLSSEPALDFSFLLKNFELNKKNITCIKLNDSLLSYSMSVSNSHLKYDSIILTVDTKYGIPRKILYIGKSAIMANNDKIRNEDSVEFINFEFKNSNGIDSLYSIKRFLSIDSIRLKITNLRRLK